MNKLEKVRASESVLKSRKYCLKIPIFSNRFLQLLGLRWLKNGCQSGILNSFNRFVAVVAKTLFP
jgi:hypothetical protein